MSSIDQQRLASPDWRSYGNTPTRASWVWFVGSPVITSITVTAAKDPEFLNPAFRDQNVFTFEGSGTLLRLACPFALASGIDDAIDRLVEHPPAVARKDGMLLYDYKIMNRRFMGINGAKVLMRELPGVLSRVSWMVWPAEESTGLKAIRPSLVENAQVIPPELEKIAQQILEIPTLRTRMSDRLDFHDLHVVNLSDALKAAGARSSFELEQIARTILKIPTLKVQVGDRFDFHELHVATILRALMVARGLKQQRGEL